MTRAVLLVAGALFLGVWVWSWAVLPADGVAQQVGSDGTVSRRGSRAELLVGLLVVAAVFVPVRWIPRLARDGTPHSFSYPWKEYWLAPERRALFVRKMTQELDVLIAGAFLLLTVGLVELVGITLGRGWPSLMVPTLVGFGGFLVWWCWWLLRRARPPAEQ